MEQLEKTHSDIQAAFEHGEKQTQVVELNGHEVLLTHKDIKVDYHLFEKMQITPLQCKTTLNLHDAKSFAEYVNKYADESSVIFADIEASKFTAVLDYHHSTDEPRHGFHVAIYAPTATPEWSAWIKHSGVKMTQEDFSLFIEDNADEIQKPVSAEMLEIASSLRADIKTTFRSAQRLDNGQVQFTYNENINGTAGASGQLQIPQEIEVIMTPFQGGPSYTRTARFRYRIKEGQLVMWYDLVRPQRVREEAMADTLEIIKEKVKDCSFYMGQSPTER